MTATPVASTAPVLTATASGSATSALVGPLQPSTTYQITVTNTDAEGASQTSSPIEAKSPGTDEGPPGEEPKASEPPEFGRCPKVPAEKEGTMTVYQGGFTTATCQEASATHAGKFEWYPWVVKARFKTVIKPTTTATLESVSKVKVTCTGESSSGEITARHIALDLYPVGRTGPFLGYTCNGSGPATLSGSVLAPGTAGKMLTTATLKFTATAGKQKPESFEGGEPYLLLSSLFEEVGLTVASTQANEEAIEINTAV